VRHTTFSNLYSPSRYLSYRASRQLSFRSRIRLVIQVFWLLVWGIACFEIPPAQASNHTVRFAVIGDYGQDGQPELDVLNLVKSWTPAFIITVGDNNYICGYDLTIDANIGKSYQEFIHPYLGTYGPGDPTNNRFFPSLGNHDWGECDGNQGDVPPYQGTIVPYLNYFTALPGNQRYYDFSRAGLMHLFAIDSDAREPDGVTSTSTQALWLQTRLASSTEPWKVVYFHHSPYTAGLYISESLQKDYMQWPFEAWGANAVLSGHSHSYERITMGNIPYIVNGLGGNFDVGITPLGPPLPGTIIQYENDHGAMLVQASPTCLNFRFIDRVGTQQDTYTLYRLSQNPSETPSANPNPPVDYYVRDWTDSPTSGDTGIVPSTHPEFYTTSDVWNRQSNAPGAFNANNQPQNEDPKNGPAAAGDNFAFARIHRNTCGNGPAEPVTARFLYSEFGTGSNFQTAGSASGAVINFAAETATTPDSVRTMAAGQSWHLPTTSSTHLCLATEISTALDPSGPTLLGHAPGWPTTDTMVLDDNNKAQRNMGVYHTLTSGRWSFYAIAHNAAIYKRSMTLRYKVPPHLMKSKVRVEVINPNKIPLRPEGRPLPEDQRPPETLTQTSTSYIEAFQSGNTILLENMQPGENRWIGVTFDFVNGKWGESLPVSFFEVVDNKTVNGFLVAAAPAPWNIVSRDILKFHASVFARLGDLFEIANAKEQNVDTIRFLQMDKITEQDYIRMLRHQISAVSDIIADLLKSQRSNDDFGIRAELKSLAGAIQEGAVFRALPAHSTFLHKLDASLTMLQKSKGDPADILQNVVWQTDLYTKLPPQKALHCSKRPHSGEGEKIEAGDVVVESREFRKAYETRKITNDDYPSLISNLLPCFRETAKEFGSKVSLEEDIANMVKSLNSPVALQRSHYGYLLKLQSVVKKPKKP